MAIDYDLTGKSFPVPGVQTYTNSTRQFAFNLDVAEIGATTASKSYGIFKVPSGNAVVGMKAVVTTGCTGTGASLTFGIAVGTASTINFGSACAVGNLGKGVVLNRTLDSVLAASSTTDETTFVFTQGTAAATAFGATVILDTIPIVELTTKG